MDNEFFINLQMKTINYQSEYNPVLKMFFLNLEYHDYIYINEKIKNKNVLKFL